MSMTEQAVRMQTTRCRFDTDGDGSCHLHPDGCPGTDAATDNHLKDVALVQHLFKGAKVQAVAVAIGNAFADAPGESIWADDIGLPELDDASKNCIGTAWKQLARWKIIQRLEGEFDHRRSTNPTSKGRTVWRYRLLDAKLLRAFLRANGVEQKPVRHEQPQLL